MEGNAIHDPCFSLKGKSDRALCGANPATGAEGFVLKLTEPPPKSTFERGGTPEPWIIELADGSICEAATGTMAGVDGKVVRYPCSPERDEKPAGESEFSGILGQPKRGPTWTADKVWLAIRKQPSKDGPFEVVKRKTVAIRRVWE